ncbi:MAG: hypothetical protein JO126_00185 [Alphaproteobacteria bacterium]|nr:hypothetical protein [Alphaproteobacteria bacterium]MBV8547860.1 hypothetical protein [Alphaproteobacteria bacterium]
MTDLKKSRGLVRGLIAILVLMMGLLAVTSADARGGRSDDCPPDSTDPDCKP